jgi:hypothetical protein
MRDPEVENALANEPTIVPSAGFSKRVMDAVRREGTSEVTGYPSVPFPWRIVLSGVGLAAVVIVAAAVAGEATLSASKPEAFGPLNEVIAWLSTTGAGSFLIVWWSLRLTSRP